MSTPVCRPLLLLFVLPLSPLAPAPIFSNSLRFPGIWCSHRDIRRISAHTHTCRLTLLIIFSLTSSPVSPFFHVVRSFFLRRLIPALRPTCLPLGRSYRSRTSFRVGCSPKLTLLVHGYIVRNDLSVRSSSGILHATTFSLPAFFGNFASGLVGLLYMAQTFF